MVFRAKIRDFNAKIEVFRAKISAFQARKAAANPAPRLPGSPPLPRPHAEGLPSLFASFFLLITVHCNLQIITFRCRILEVQWSVSQVPDKD